MFSPGILVWRARVGVVSPWHKLLTVQKVAQVFDAYPVVKVLSSADAGIVDGYELSAQVEYGRAAAARQ